MSFVRYTGRGIISEFKILIKTRIWFCAIFKLRQNTKTTPNYLA